MLRNVQLHHNSAEKEEIKAIVESYREEREQGRDGIAYVTQPFWYAGKLSRQAMAEHGIVLKQKYQGTKRKKEDKEYLITYGEGDYKRIEYHGPGYNKKVYYKEGRPVLKVSDHLQERYVLADTRHENSGAHFCENCGALIDYTKSYEGCPYCKAAVRTREVHKKIVSVGHEIFLDWHFKTWIESLMGLFFILSLFAGVIPTLQEYGVSIGVLLFSILTTLIPSLLMGGFFGVIFGNIFFFPIMLSRELCDSRIKMIGYKMRKLDPAFSETEFYGLAEAYLKIWFVSQKQEDLGYISEIDQCPDDILDMEVIKCKKGRIYHDLEYSYVEMRLKVYCVQMRGQKPVKRNRICRMTMKRRKNIISTLKAEMLKCPSCGAPLDILSCGKCSYCDQTADISSIDWVLCKVEIEK